MFTIKPTINNVHRFAKNLHHNTLYGRSYEQDKNKYWIVSQSAEELKMCVSREDNKHSIGDLDIIHQQKTLTQRMIQEQTFILR